MLSWPQPIPGEPPEATVRRVFAWAQSLFDWTSDIDAWQRPEHWPLESELEEHAAVNDGRIKDDCDGEAALCRYALWKLKVPNRLLICDVEPSAAKPAGGNHCVCIPENMGLVMDCRQPRVVSREELERIGYTWIEMSGLEPGDDWVTVI